MPYFITVRNGGGQELDVVTEGNEHVIRARFADAAYFVREDTQAAAGRFPAAAGHAHLPDRAGLDAG